MTRLLVLLYCVLFFTSCEKEYSFEGDPGNLPEEIPLAYIRCSIDGASKTFNVLAKASRQNTSGQFVISVFGKATERDDDVERINLGISSTQDIVQGTYSENDPSFSFVVDAVYNPDNLTDVWAVGFTPNPANPFTIIITEINPNFVRGTFRGDVYNNGGSGSLKKTISNGEFFVPF
jgi:hypothetical protein